ncbi:MAG TPA: hypothetical protein VFP23_08540, partial [Solirubrobacterales bacterium]|nr:hypothetical protein [Solirubrobacterales bacterium]
MEAPRRDMKWWGWGDPAVEPRLDAEALATLRERLGELEPSPRPAALEEVELPPAEALPPARPLTRAQQLAVVKLAGRAARLTPARVD